MGNCADRLESAATAQQATGRAPRGARAVRLAAIVGAVLLFAGLAPGEGGSPPPAGPVPPSTRARPVATGDAGPVSEVRERILASIVGLGVTLPDPKLTFHGKRKVVAEVNPSHGVGSGIVVDSSGLILTCAHVVSDQSVVRVFLNDDREVEGTVKVADRASDLALVEVHAGSLPSLDLWTPPELRAGADVYLGSRPGGAELQFTSGTLTNSGTYHVGHSPLEFFRQFVGEVEPGESGGALVDEQGRFIGIMAVGFSEGKIGYAIAREFVLITLARLRAGPPVIWPWLGLGLETPDQPPGSVVWTVASGSPAHGAGFKPGDRIVSLDGHTVEHFLPLMLAIVAKPVGSRFTLGVVRVAPPAVSAGRAGSPPTAPGANSKIEYLSLLSVARPLEPALSPIAVFGRWTGIQLAPAPSAGLDPAGLKVVGLPPQAGAGPNKYQLGSHLIAIIPGVGVVRTLEEGRTDQEIPVRTPEDLGSALKESVFGDRITALLVWSTQGHKETMLMSGEAKRFALL